MKNLMKMALMEENYARFVNLEIAPSPAESTEKIPEIIKFNKDLSKAEALLLEQDLAKKVEKGNEKKEIDPSDLEDLKTIQIEVKKIIDKVKSLTASDFDVEKGNKDETELPTSHAENLAEEIENIGKKLDDFRERDLGSNKSNTSFSHEIGNYLANIEARLREAIAFSKNAKRALDAHKDLAGLDENKITSIKDAKDRDLIDPIFYDPKLKDNPFKNDVGGEDDISIPQNFDLTSKAYSNSVKNPEKWGLVQYIAEYRRLSNSLKDELDKPLESQDKGKINNWSILIKTAKNNIDSLKNKIKQECIPQDMVNVVFNPALKNLKENDEKVREEIDKYDTQREAVKKYIKDEYLNPDEVEKGILSPKLTGAPYKLASAKNLDEKIKVLEKYVSKSQVNEKYKTDDLDDDFRKRNLFNTIGSALRGSKDFLKEQRKVPQFKKIDEALASFKGSSRKEINGYLDDYVESVIDLPKNAGKEIDKKEIREKIAADILTDINTYVVYHNAEVMLKEIKEKLDIVKKDPGENENNTKLQEKRFTKLSLNESLKDKFNYEAKKQEIDDEIYTKQPKLFKESFEASQKYYVAERKEKISLKRMNKIKDLLLKSNGKDYNFEKDVDFISKKEIHDEFAKKATDAEEKANSIKKEIETSFNKVKNIYGEFAGVAYKKVNINLVNSRKKKKEKEAEEAKKKIQIGVVKGAQELEAGMIKENNSEAVQQERKKTDKELNSDDTFLKKQERKLIEMENNIKEYEKELKRMRRDRKELIILQTESKEKEK